MTNEIFNPKFLSIFDRDTVRYLSDDSVLSKADRKPVPVG